MVVISKAMALSTIYHIYIQQHTSPEILQVNGKLHRMIGPKPYDSLSRIGVDEKQLTQSDLSQSLYDSMFS